MKLMLLSGQIFTKTRPTIDDSLMVPNTRPSLESLPVVAEHEDAPGGDHAARLAVRRLPAAGRDAPDVGRGALGQVGLHEPAAVDVDLVDAPHRAGGDRVAGQADDPLHEVVDAVPARFGRGVEDDDVASVHVVEVVAELVDQDPVADHQRRLHRPGRDVERLEQERLDQERDRQRGGDQHHPLDDDALGARSAGGLLGPGSAEAGRLGGPVGGRTVGRGRGGARRVRRDERRLVPGGRLVV